MTDDERMCLIPLLFLPRSRMNVALTRARSSIWILGDSNKLRSNQYWSNLVGDAETRGLFRNVSLLHPDRFFSSSLALSPSQSSHRSRFRSFALHHSG